MKNNLLIKTSLACLMAIMFSTGIFAQTAVVGALRNGKPVVSDVNQASLVLKGGLSPGATVSNVYIEQEPESGKYFLFGKIGNDNVTGKAIELRLASGIFSAVGGPGVEVSCFGYKCASCLPRISGGKVRCVCEDPNPPSDMRCDMSSKVTISLW